MQYGTRMLNDWQELKSKYPTQINAVTIVDANGNQGSFMHIRTKLFNHLIRSKTMANQELDTYREKQHNLSIDSLTSQLKQMEIDISAMETSLSKKQDECSITKDTLRLKAEGLLQSLHYEDATDQLELNPGPGMLSASDLDDLNVNFSIDEPTRKMSHENK